MDSLLRADPEANYKWGYTAVGILPGNVELRDILKKQVTLGLSLFLSSSACRFMLAQLGACDESPLIATGHVVGVIAQQDYMYTVISKNSRKLIQPDPDMEEQLRVIGSLKEILLAFETPGKVCYTLGVQDAHSSMDTRLAFLGTML
jgi:hypothetical protein